MTIMMPASDQAVLARRDEIVAALRAIVPGEGVIDSAAEMRALRVRRADRLSPAADGGGAAGDHRAGRRRSCAIATSTASRWCRAAPAPRCPAARCRWPMACCSAWASSTASSRSISTTACVVAEPGVTNLAISQAVEHAGLLLRARSVVADRLLDRRQCRGEFRRRALPEIRPDHQQRARHRDGADDRRGHAARRQASRDARATTCSASSPARKACSASSPRSRCASCRSRRPRAPCWSAFAEVEEAGECVAEIIGAGIIPGGMEMMDRPAIHAAEDFVHAGYPLDVEALLIVELDGPGVEVDHLIEPGRGDRAALRLDHAADLHLGGGAQPVLGRPQGGVSGGRPHLAGLFLHGRHHPARRAAAGAGAHARAVGEIRPARRQRLPCRRRQSASADPLRRQQARRAGHGPRRSAPTSCGSASKVGGVLTGEHGVGVEKRDLMPEMFTEIDLDQQQRLKCAFDAQGLLNPGKVFPTLHRCAELGRMHVHGGKLRVSRHLRGFDRQRRSRCDDPLADTKYVTPRMSSRRCARRSPASSRWKSSATAPSGDRPADGDQCAARSVGAERGDRPTSRTN